MQHNNIKTQQYFNQYKESNNSIVSITILSSVFNQNYFILILIIFNNYFKKITQLFIWFLIIKSQLKLIV